jgi:hypothetical protein
VLRDKGKGKGVGGGEDRPPGSGKKRKKTQRWVNAGEGEPTVKSTCEVTLYYFCLHLFTPIYVYSTLSRLSFLFTGTLSTLSNWLPS